MFHHACVCPYMSCRTSMQVDYVCATFSALAQRVPPIQQTLESCIYPAWNLYLPEEGTHLSIATYLQMHVVLLFYIVYSASSSASKSVQGFKEYFNFHKSFYDNVRKL